MKVLHIIPTYIPAWRASGPINVTHSLNKWLVKKGIEVTVYTSNVDGPTERLNVPVNVPVDIDGVRVFYFSLSFPRRWFYSTDLRKALIANLRDFDVVHITSAFLAASTIGAYYARKFQKPYIISTFGSFMKRPLQHSVQIKKLYLRFLEKRNLAGASALHFVSEKERSEYQELRFPVKRERVIFSGVDPAVLTESATYKGLREKLHLSRDSNIVLFLGRFHWIKGFDTLIPAFARVVKENPNVYLLLVGYDDGGYEKEVRRLVEVYGLKKRVVIPGAFSINDKIRALRESDVFILPSYSEASSIAVLEALYCGLPVVITKDCGFSDEISASDAGLVVEKSEVAVSEALLRLLKDKEEARRVSKNAAAFAKKFLTFESVAENYKALYNEVIGDFKKNL